MRDRRRSGSQSLRQDFDRGDLRERFGDLWDYRGDYSEQCLYVPHCRFGVRGEYGVFVGDRELTCRMYGKRERLGGVYFRLGGLE